MLTLTPPLLLLQVALGHHLLRHVQLGPDAHTLRHVVRLGHPELQGLAAPLCHADHLGVGEVEDVDPVDGEEDVADAEAGALGRGARLYGGHHHGPRAVDAEAELSLQSLNHHGFVAF